MDATEVTAALNAMAMTTSEASQRKRSRLSDQNEDTSNNKRTKMETQNPEQKASAVNRRSSNRLQRQSLPSIEPEPSDRNDAIDLPPSSEAVTKDLSNENAAKKTKKMIQFRNAKSSAPKASPFRGHAFGSLDPLQNTKAQLTSLDSPAKGTRSRSNRVAANPLDALQNHPIIPKPIVDSTNAETPRKVVPEKPRPETSNTESPRKSNRKPTKQTVSADSQPETAQIDNVGSDTEINVQRNRREDITDDADKVDDIEPTQKARPEVTKRKGRKPKSKEEIERKEEGRLAKQLRDATKVAENAEESAKAEEEVFDNRCAKFMRGISDFAKDMNLYETWATAGGAALTIRSMVSNGYDSKSVRAEAVMRQILRIADLYAGLENSGVDLTESSKKILENIQVLRNRTEASFLVPENDSQKRGDPTAIEIYEHLIPKIVWLLKQSLRARYDGGLSRDTNKELLKLTKAGLNLCDIASGWQPSPSILEHGIKRMVRIHIRPNLYKLWSHFARNETYMAHHEWEDQQSRELAARQAQSRKLMMKRMLSTLVNQPLPSSKQQNDDVVDLEEIETVKTRNRHERYERQPTEEIPAPDPSIPWTDKENVALLNGLQEFLDGDRYTRILEKYPQLSSKDLDQIMAQAQFFKRVTERKIRNLENQGDHSLSWLSTVVL